VGCLNFVYVISYRDLFTANKQLLDMKLAEYWSLFGVIEANDIPDLFELVENSSCIVNKGSLVVRVGDSDSEQKCKIHLVSHSHEILIQTSWSSLVLKLGTTWSLMSRLKPERHYC